MKFIFILASAIIAVGIHRWLHRPTAYRTPTSVTPEIITYAQDQLYGQYRNNTKPQTT